MIYTHVVLTILEQIPDYISHCPALPAAIGLCIVGSVIWLAWEVVDF